MKQKNTVYIRVLLVVLSIVVLLVFTNRAPQRVRHDTWLPSSYNPLGAGTMALFETLQDLHWPVARWREPLSRLNSEGTDNVLIIARSKTGSPVNFSDQEITLLDDWVKRGNTLVLLGALTEWDDTRELLEEIGFGVPDKPTPVTDFWDTLQPDNVQTIDLQPAAAVAATGTLVVPRSEPLPVTLPTGAHRLWEKDGAPYIVEVPRGAGQVICGTSERLLSSSFLEKGDNLAITLSLLMPKGQVPNHLFFEESHNGYSAVFAMVRLLDQPGLRFAGMLALLGALAFLGSSLVRFGPVIPLHRATGRSSLEFVDSMADLYMRADLRRDTIQYLFTETHQQVLQRLNLPPTAPHELIASRLERAHPQLPKWKKLAQRFDSNDYTEGLPPGGWLRVARELIEIKTALA
jgi:hypothetical protein